MTLQTKNLKVLVCDDPACEEHIVEPVENQPDGLSGTVVLYEGGNTSTVQWAACTMGHVEAAIRYVLAEEQKRP